MVFLLMEKFGFTQSKLASLINVEPSMLSRFDEGKRKLPIAAMEEMTAYLKMLSILPAPPKPQPTEKDKADLKYDAEGYELECVQLQKKLTKTQLHYQQACNMLYLLDNRGPILATDRDNKQDWLNIIRDYTEIKLQENGWKAQNKLQRAIDTLQQKIKWCGEDAG